MDIDDVKVLWLVLWLAGIVFVIGYTIYERESINDEHYEYHPYLVGEVVSNGDAISVGIDSNAESNSTAVVYGKTVRSIELGDDINHVIVTYENGSKVNQTLK